MESLGKVLSHKTLTKILIQLLLACILLSLLHPCAGHHPYQPQMWTFRNFLTGDIIGQDVTNTPAWTVRLRDIFTSDRSGEVSKDITVETYWCPSQNPVIVVPRILYHTDEEVTRHLQTEPRRARWEVITAISLAMLLALGGTGAATGVTALATQGKGLQQLQKTIDEDLLRIHENIMKLEESLFSLSEVVLQNRRGLDLLLMQQGGLCAALNEECCTYVNHSGLIRKSMAELKNRIERRKLELEQRNWFNDLFGQYPWIAPIVSALVGPVVIVLLVLIFGPCLLNKIAQFVKSRLSRIEVMVLQQKQLT